MSASQRQPVGKNGNVRCGNCSIWVSPVWRYQKTLQMLLCNACSCCYASKGVHRAKPSPEALEKIAQAFEAKQTRSQAALNSGSGAPETDQDRQSRLIYGKRKRQPRTWGTDVITYQEEEKGTADAQECGADRHKVERAEFDMYKRWSDSHYNDHSSDASDEDELSPRMAAEILTSMKFAKVELEGRPVSKPVDLRRMQRTTTGFTAGVDGMVYLSLAPHTEAQRMKKPVKPERCCSRCGATETPTWRKAGGNLDLCNACGVRISAKARNRQHPPLPARPTANATQKTALQPALSLPVNTSEAAVRQTCMLPKAASMPTATQKHDSRLIFEQFLGQPQALPSALPAAFPKPAKNLDYVAAAQFSPFHPLAPSRAQSNEDYRPPQRSLFQMVQPKITKPDSQDLLPKDRQDIPCLASQTSNLSGLSSNESLLQTAGYFFSQESLYG